MAHSPTKTLTTVHGHARLPYVVDTFASAKGRVQCELVRFCHPDYVISLFDDEMDSLVVAWMKHRGIEVEYLSDQYCEQQSRELQRLLGND